MKDVPSEKVKEYLDLFEGDVLQAVRALREVGYGKPAAPAAPRRPLSDEVLIRVEDLKKSYKVGKQHVNALNGVTLDVHKGEFLALTGASGSGKSTLLQLMGGLDKPSEGSVTIHGNKLASLNDKKLSEFRNKTVGFVFQFFYLQPFLRLRQNLEVAGMPARTKRPVRRERVAQLAEVVGLGDRLEHFPKELSGGQMQRAAIARALLNNPEILLADEPTGNLDSENGKAIIDLFEKIRNEFGTTIVVVTHDAAIAARADREVSLKDGVLL